MHDSDLTSKEDLISKLNEDRAWILKNIDCGKWPEIRSELASLEREISKFILRVNEYNSDTKSD